MAIFVATGAAARRKILGTLDKRQRERELQVLLFADSSEHQIETPMHGLGALRRTNSTALGITPLRCRAPVILSSNQSTHLPAALGPCCVSDPLPTTPPANFPTRLADWGEGRGGW
eukprot:CAMPEP_0180050476 /NCGR_PEP_ID=MMETSP0985-20121206/613_1 /TAXON_ID=483367 /ORGANISM="non described non described, Strain CCMP 2436" /LENGTH=115 /DNA_ID=CAMNT_0021979603 /DNA_START=188 /DNA_END=534 /DNA_ORIENTATION=-